MQLFNYDIKYIIWVPRHVNKLILDITKYDNTLYHRKGDPEIPATYPLKGGNNAKEKKKEITLCHGLCVREAPLGACVTSSSAVFFVLRDLAPIQSYSIYYRATLSVSAVSTVWCATTADNNSL